MAGFFSKASSFLSSHTEQEAPAPTSHPGKEEEHLKPASSGGYGDLIAGAQSLMQGGTKSSAEEGTHKSPEDLFAGAQAFMGAAKKPNVDDDDNDKSNKEAHKSPSSGGFGDIFAGVVKPDGGDDALIDKEANAHKPASLGYGDVLASTQVLMKAAKVSGEANMGEVAGATANLIGAGASYGNIEKTPYGEYAHKAETYLRDYQVSHGKPAASDQGSAHQTPPSKEDKENSTPIPSIKAPIKSADREEDDDQRE